MSENDDLNALVQEAGREYLLVLGAVEATLIELGVTHSLAAQFAAGLARRGYLIEKNEERA